MAQIDKAWWRQNLVIQLGWMFKKKLNEFSRFPSSRNFVARVHNVPNLGISLKWRGQKIIEPLTDTNQWPPDDKWGALASWATEAPNINVDVLWWGSETLFLGRMYLPKIWCIAACVSFWDKSNTHFISTWQDSSSNLLSLKWPSAWNDSIHRVKLNFAIL